MARTCTPAPAVETKRSYLPPVPRIKGELRTVLLEHQEAMCSARLVLVETGEVDRRSGKPERVFYEVTVKPHRVAEITRTFSHEYHARVAYDLAQRGITDFSTPLGELGPRLWDEPKNMGRLAALRDAGWPEVAHRTRINTGANEPDPPKPARAAMVNPPGRPNGASGPDGRFALVGERGLNPQPRTGASSVHSDRPVVARTFAAALWLLAKGHEPIGLGRDGESYLFPSSALPDLGGFLQAKDVLNNLTPVPSSDASPHRPR